MNATPTEQWLPVVGLEGQYEVSDQGIVRSVDRTIDYIDGRSGKSCTRFAKGKVLSPGSMSSGHLHVHIGGISRTVHGIVAAAFIGPRQGADETRHINGNPADCRAVNLEYGSRSDNAEDSKRHGTHFHAGRTHCKRGHELVGENLQNNGKDNKRTCLACRRERQALYNSGTQVTTEGHCINGHPMTPENRYTNGPRGTRCKPCALERKKAA